MNAEEKIGYVDSCWSADMCFKDLSMRELKLIMYKMLMGDTADGAKFGIGFETGHKEGYVLAKEEMVGRKT